MSRTHKCPGYAYDRVVEWAQKQDGDVLRFYHSYRAAQASIEIITGQYVRSSAGIRTEVSYAVAPIEDTVTAFHDMMYDSWLDSDDCEEFYARMNGGSEKDALWEGCD